VAVELVGRLARFGPKNAGMWAIAAQLGLALGARIAERWRERAERIAGIALILLGAYLIAEQLTR
jgi:hypothetical protein